jgi:hypothetical protein
MTLDAIVVVQDNTFAAVVGSVRGARLICFAPTASMTMKAIALGIQAILSYLSGKGWSKYIVILRNIEETHKCTTL